MVKTIAIRFRRIACCCCLAPRELALARYGRDRGILILSSKWSEIWQQRILAEKQSDINLIDLLRLNGWDSGAGYLNSNDWIQFTKSIAQQIGLQDGMSIFEVGCGGGAFLYPLANSFDIEIGGLDYAPNLVATAKLALPKGQFSTGDACSLDAAP